MVGGEPVFVSESLAVGCQRVWDGTRSSQRKARLGRRPHGDVSGSLLPPADRQATRIGADQEGGVLAMLRTVEAYQALPPWAVGTWSWLSSSAMAW
jgi:hypothetical protein